MSQLSASLAGNSAANARNRRAIMLGSIILVPALLWVYGVQPYRRALAKTHDDIEEQQMQLERDRTLVSRLGTLPRTSTSLSTQLRDEAPRLFSPDDDLTATGELAEYIGDAATTYGVQVQQIETRPSRPLSAGVQALALEVRAEGDIAGILPFLQHLESGDKLVRVGALSIERARGAVDTTKMGGAEVLTVSASVYGYRLTDARLVKGDPATTGGPSPFTRQTPDLASLTQLIDNDAFSPSRTRPSPAYQLATAGGPAKPAAPLPALRLVGTVISPAGRSFAMCQIGTAAPRVVRVGGQIAGYTLHTLARGRAVFASPSGESLELHAPTPGT
jgi:type II secretory pathway component PulM